MNTRNQKRTTRRVHKILSCVAVFTLIFNFTGCSRKTPREALEEAYEKTFVTGSPAEHLLGLAELNSRLDANNAHSSGLSLTLQELSGEGLEEFAGVLSGLGFSIDTASDLLNRKSSGIMNITYGGTTCLSLSGQINGSNLYLTIPQLLDGSLSVHFSTLNEDLASDSLMAQLFTEAGITLPEDFSMDNLFGASAATDALAQFGTLLSACEDFEDALLVEKADKKSVSLPSEVSAKNIYNVTIPADAYVNVMNATMESVSDYSNALLEVVGETAVANADMEEFRASVDRLAALVGDIVLTVAVTKDGYIRYVESVVESETETFTLTAAFTGDKNPLNNTAVTFVADIDGELFKLTCEQTFDTDTSALAFSADFDYENETLLRISGEGEFTDMEKGEKYTFDMNYLELDLAGMFSASLAGSYYVDTTQCDISEPSGTEYNLFTMSEQDFSDLLVKMITKIRKNPLLSGLLNYIAPGYSYH